MDPGFPKLIAESWNGIPDDIDSAFSLNGIGKITFLSHIKYMQISVWQFCFVVWYFWQDIDTPVTKEKLLLKSHALTNSTRLRASLSCRLLLS